jgi:hypothetical protein
VTRGRGEKRQRDNVTKRQGRRVYEGTRGRLLERVSPTTTAPYFTSIVLFYIVGQRFVGPSVM